MTAVFRIAQSGLAAQSERLAVAAANVANLHSLGRHPDPAHARPDAYVPQRVAQVSGPEGGVKVRSVPVAPAAFLRYEPDNPDADPQGLVPRPNGALEQETVARIEARRLFQANLRLIEVQDEMLGDLLDVRS